MMNILGVIGVLEWSIVADYRGIWLSEDNRLIRSLVIKFLDVLSIVSANGKYSHPSFV